MVEPKFTETQDAHEVGKHWTGKEVNLLTGSRPYRYGFILWFDPSKDRFFNLGNSEQVILQINPESITIDEPASTTIVPTQNAGKFIERQGQIIKNITITGTTGFNFNPRTFGAIRATLPQSQVVEQEGPTSGMARFIELRNIFRKYWEIFSEDAAATTEELKDAIFIFVNEKDDEAWVVEPMGFRMTRQAPRDKFIYRYDIQLQTIALLENINFAEDPSTLFERVQNVKNAASQILNDVSSAAAGFEAGIRGLTGSIKELGDTIIGVANVVVGSLQSVVDGVNALLDFPQTVARDFVTLAEQFHGLEDALVALSGGAPSPVPELATTSLTSLNSSISSLSGRVELFESEFPFQYKESLKNYDARYGVGGVNQTLLAPLTKKSISETSMLKNEDISAIALRTLGDAERFQEIIVLNGLKPPYVSPSVEERLPNTIAPGDSVLLPVTAAADNSSRVPVKSAIHNTPAVIADVITSTTNTVKLDTVVRDFRIDQWEGFTLDIIFGTGEGQTRKVLSNTGDTITVDVNWVTLPDTTSVARIQILRLDSQIPQKSAFEQILGVDLKLEQEKNPDMVAAQSGDSALVSGNKNMAQAIIIKLQSSPGDFVVHPAFGLAFSPGQQANADTLLAYRIAVKQTLRSDPRIIGIQGLKVVARGDILELEGTVTLAGQSQPFALDTRGTS